MQAVQVVFLDTLQASGWLLFMARSFLHQAHLSLDLEMKLSLVLGAPGKLFSFFRTFPPFTFSCKRFGTRSAALCASCSPKNHLKLWFQPETLNYHDTDSQVSCEVIRLLLGHPKWIQTAKKRGCGLGSHRLISTARANEKIKTSATLHWAWYHLVARAGTVTAAAQLNCCLWGKDDSEWIASAEPEPLS